MIKLDHPNIVKHFTWFKEEFFDEEMKKEMTKYTLIMEYADDGNLWNKIDSRHFKKEVIQLLFTIRKFFSSQMKF
jgi:hypothetical protein